MPLFRKSHNKDKDTKTSGHNDPSLSNSGANPNFMGHDQRGAKNGPEPGYNSTQQSYPNGPDYSGSGHSDPHSKPSRLGGKVESAVGKVLGSDSLRAKGIEKEREARSLNMQSSELAQAESLEREAQMHRDRAMGGGGGVNLANSNSDRQPNN